jgi:hypothetical protein
VLIGMVATLIGISLALTLRDIEQAKVVPPVRPAGIEQTVNSPRP